jgi:hypothetical protein
MIRARALQASAQREPAAEILIAAGDLKTSGAGRGNRTPTVLSDLRILSPLRLPISPSRLAIILAYQPSARGLSLGLPRSSLATRYPTL